MTQTTVVRRYRLLDMNIRTKNEGTNASPSDSYRFAFRHVRPSRSENRTYMTSRILFTHEQLVNALGKDYELSAAVSYAERRLDDLLWLCEECEELGIDPATRITGALGSYQPRATHRCVLSLSEHVHLLYTADINGNPVLLGVRDSLEAAINYAVNNLWSNGNIPPQPQPTVLIEHGVPK